ncbi:MAG TPA: ATP-binding protein [Kofleriaceae bacterium]|nr:ATP-binding protein [Kofleriaceae bacterium]
MAPDRDDKLDERGDDTTALGFKRHFVLPGVVMAVLELIAIVWPLLSLFQPAIADDGMLLRIAIPVLAGAQLTWWAAVGSWLTPIYRAIQLKRRGQRLPDELALSSYRGAWRVPRRALFLRTGLWIAVALALGFFLTRYGDWTSPQVVELAAVAGLHAFSVNLVRSVWYHAILYRLRGRLFASVPPLQRFADGYFEALVHVALVVSGCTAAAIVAFAYYFLPISLEQYLQLAVVVPVALLAALIGMALHAHRSRRLIDAYVRAGAPPPAADRDPGDSMVGGAPSATSVYRRGQALPYRLALAHLALWATAGAVCAWVARSELSFEFDDTILMLGIWLDISIGSAIFQVLWHRETVRPLLEQITTQHRLPVRAIRPSLSLRAKLLLSFGGMVLFAVGLALFWGFIQYKNLVTEFTSKQADLGITWLRSEVQGAVVAEDRPPTPSLVRRVLRSVDRTSPEAANAVFYYVSNEPKAQVLALGGGPMGAPVLPWYARAQLTLGAEEPIDLDSHSLSGRHGRLIVTWPGDGEGSRYDLGGMAVFYPNYRGRGPSVVRPLKELILFFLVLFGTCAGIVLFTVAQFVKPIRRLEQRADGMARGELAQPVSSGGEGDEIGRLTFALEEMRRALREKLRSTEEVNLDLERAVQRRTADLAKKNRELAETLEKLTRAQDQLVRSEKMASIGQLVAGIAHEINNPVNAIVNTVGPLEGAIADITAADEATRAEARSDVVEMLRVVQNGAQRTKAIVQALHNYSRTDDESVVEVDLNRSLDDSLELLRHLLRQSVHVEREYGGVGRIRGHAGQLNQVFMNLLTNAAQAVAGRDNATVWVATREDADTGGVVIEVRDNGAGIPPGVLPRIFDPFFTTKDVGEGSGLGLSIVHGIVERHGGSIEVDSTESIGTRFRVHLPRR